MNDFQILKKALNTETDSQVIEIQQALMIADRETTRRYAEEAFELCRLIVHSIPLAEDGSGVYRDNALGRMEEAKGWVTRMMG